MARVLRLRRGDAGSNAAFIGMEGEITFDTENKILHVHDGETAGGFKIARADLSNVDMSNYSGETSGDSSFDINSVSSEFWNALFLEYNLCRKNFGISGNCSISNAAYMEYVFNTITNVTAENATADMILLNQLPEAGYAIGDIVHAFGIGNFACPKPIIFSDVNGVHLRQLIGNESFWVSHKTTGVKTTIDNSNWKAKFRIWY